MPLTFAETPLYYRDSQGQYHRILSGADMSAYRTSAAQDAIDANLMALGLSGVSVGDLVRINTVDANSKPTSWKHVPLCDIVTNQNLLDNWYFVGGGSQLGDGVFPINQRGQTIYNGAGYGIDRWIYGEQTINNDENVTVSGTMYQRIAAYTAILDGVTTFSALTTSGLITASGIARNGYSATQGNGVGYDSNMNIIYVAVTNCTVIAVKLELGSEQTLAHQENGVWVLNEIPDYGEELRKCYRYFYRCKPGRIQNIASGYYNSATTVQLTGNLGIPFKGQANGTLSGSLYVTSPDHVGTNAKIVTNIGELAMLKNGILVGNVSTESVTKGNPAILQIRDSTTYIDFSVDL